jgi:FAD:protein FMN transferase
MTEERTHRFPSMGTAVTLTGPAGSHFDAAARAVEAIFDREDRRFSRFRVDSELSGVNGRAGSWTEVSEPFAELLRLALDGARRSGGLFDPTILPALVAAGYDRDYGELLRSEPLVGLPPRPGGRWREVRLDGRKVKLPDDCGLDFGGVAKGWTCDRAAEEAIRHLPWAMINAGGDLRVAGVLPAPGMEIRVEDPLATSESILRLRLLDGALATSSILDRAWGEGLHQVIDPRTQLPAVTDVVQATVWAPTCAEAEVGTTWAMLLGPAAMDALSCVLAMSGGDVFVNIAGEPRRAEVAS